MTDTSTDAVELLARAYEDEHSRDNMGLSKNVISDTLRALASERDTLLGYKDDLGYVLGEMETVRIKNLELAENLSIYVSNMGKSFHEMKTNYEQMLEISNGKSKSQPSPKHKYECWKLFGEFVCRYRELCGDDELTNFINHWSHGEWDVLDETWPEWKTLVDGNDGN